jgi:hypothetical protein
LWPERRSRRTVPSLIARGDTAWVQGLLKRQPTKVAAVALANKITRIACDPVMQLWIAYTPTDAEQRHNRTFGLLSVRRPRVP